MNQHPILSSLLLLISMVPSTMADELNWFRHTPIQPSLNALLDAQPQRAWQELILALSQSNVEGKHWQPLKEAILEQSNCGHALQEKLPKGTTTMTLSMISRSGFSSSGYQIKLSTEQLGLSGHFELISPQGIAILSGQLESSQAYQEWETSELISRPHAGLYYLKVDNHELPIILSEYDSRQWIQRSKQDRSQLDLLLPEQHNGCALATISLQWFDVNYNQIGRKQAINTNKNKALPEFSTHPKKAKHLSASAMIYEYQPGIKVEYIHRVALPF